MRLAFSDDHIALQTEFERVLSAQALPARARAAASGPRGWDEMLWRQLADLGWLGVSIEEKHGGLGQDMLSLCLLAESIGKRICALPYATSVLGFAEAIRLCGDYETADALLPGLATGEVVGALVDQDAWTSAVLEGESFSGVAPAIPDGVALTHIMTLVGFGATARLVIVGLADAIRTRLDSLDRINPALALTFQGAPARIVAQGLGTEALWRDAIARYAIFLAFVQVGGAEAALNAARAHVLQRFAFGRPLGSFQAIKHGLAEVLAAIEVARSNAWFAAASLGQNGDPLVEAAAAARVSATEAHRKAARALVHYLGALGVTEESDAQLMYRRAQALGMAPGTPRDWKERLIAITLASRDAVQRRELA